MSRRPGQKFADLAQRVEGFVLRTLVVALLLLLLAQSLLQYDGIRSLLSYVDRLEGIGYEPGGLVVDAVGATYVTPDGVGMHTISIALLSHPSQPDARLLIDDFVVADFTQGRVTIEVRDGDRLAIDTRGIPDPLRFRIVDASPGVLRPRQGEEFVLENERRELTLVDIR